MTDLIHAASCAYSGQPYKTGSASRICACGGTPAPAARTYTDLADACRTAADTLDREEHRYVERFMPCPNGCVFDYADGVTVGGQGREWPPNTPPVLVRVSGPADCTDCEDGTLEDDDAPWVNPLIENLRAAADLLADLA